MGQYNRVYGTVISLAHLDIHWVIHSAKTLDQISKEWEGSALWFYQSCKVRHFHVYSFEHWNRADHHWLRCWYKGCILYVCASNITENKTKWCTKDHILTAGHGFALSREPQNFSSVQTGAVRRYVSEIEREREMKVWRKALSKVLFSYISQDERDKHWGHTQDCIWSTHRTLGAGLVRG